MTSDMTSTNCSVDKGYRGASSSDSGERKKPFSADFALAVAYALINLLVLLLCRNVVGVQADESLNIYGALEILAGKEIYKDFWVYYAPGIFFLTAAVMSLLGKTLMALRLALIVTASLSTAALYLIGRRFLDKTLASVAPILFICAGVNLWPVASQHWYSTLSLIFCIFFAARYMSRQTGFRNILLSGMMAGITFVLQQQKGGMLGLVVCILLFLHEYFRERGHARLFNAGRASVVFVFGVAVPIIFIGAYLAMRGLLREAVTATLIFPLTHLATSDADGFANIYGLLTDRSLLFFTQFFWPSEIARKISRAMTLLINVVAPLSVLPAAGVWIFSSLRRRKKDDVALLCLAATSVCLLSALQRPDFHHLVSNLPMCYLLLGYLIASVASTVNDAHGKTVRRMRKFLVSFLIVLLFVPSGALLGGELAYARRVEPVSLGSPLGFVPVLDNEARPAVQTLTALIDFIQMNTHPNENIFVIYCSPFLYYLSERQNPTRYPFLGSSPCVTSGNIHLLGLASSPFLDNQVMQAIESIESDRTPLVILDPAATCLIDEFGDEEALKDDVLAQYLRERYEPIGYFGVFRVLQRRDDRVGAGLHRAQRPRPRLH